MIILTALRLLRDYWEWWWWWWWIETFVYAFGLSGHRELPYLLRNFTHLNDVFVAKVKFQTPGHDRSPARDLRP